MSGRPTRTALVVAGATADVQISAAESMIVNGNGDATRLLCHLRAARKLLKEARGEFERAGRTRRA